MTQLHDETRQTSGIQATGTVGLEEILAAPGTSPDGDARTMGIHRQLLHLPWIPLQTRLPKQRLNGADRIIQCLLKKSASSENNPGPLVMMIRKQMAQVPCVAQASG